MEGERLGDMSPASLLCGDSGIIFSSDTDSRTALRMLRLSLPQKGSILGSSSPSATEQGLRSGDEGMGGACCSCGEQVEGSGGEVVVGVGVWGAWADVGLLVADWDWPTAEPDGGLVRSRPPTLAVTGEWRESFRVRTGEEVREGMDRGGGEENFLQRRGDLSFMCSEPRLFWLVAKNSSKDLD